jgi:pyruvate kinase
MDREPTLPAWSARLGAWPKLGLAGQVMNRRRRDTLERIVAELDSILARAGELELRYANQLAALHPRQVVGGRNLLHYLALRHSDVSELQYELASLGLSSLGRSESHVLASICAVRTAVHHLLGIEEECPAAPVTLREGRGRIRRQTETLFGRKRKGSSVRIMVTLPIEAADDYRLVLKMVRAGMNCARINCAAGGPAEWERMVSFVHRARRSTGRGCKIFMDLAGPKIRIGDLVPGPEVVRIRPPLDEWGRVKEPVLVQLVSEGAAGRRRSGLTLPVSQEVLDAAQPGRSVELTDTRGQPLSLRIDSVTNGSARASCWQEAYVETGLPLSIRDEGGGVRAEGSLAKLPETRPGIRLRIGDTLRVHKNPRLGEGALRAHDGDVVEPAHVSCAMPEVLDRVEVGHELVLDDGKFRSIITEVRSDEIVVEITHAAPGGAKLRARKGINLPDSQIGLFGLTEKDRGDLPFVVEHADGVNVSFVNHPDDVEDLLDELEAAGGHELALVLKIETLMGFRHLPGILLAAMEWPAVGVMIARGDLAAEVGWTHLARAQEEILWLCEAAHFPVVWATEVLNQLAKKGIPTRGEISDVVMAKRAECVMLNKGPHITTTIRTLDSILSSMQAYQTKKTALLPALPLEPPDPEEVGRGIGLRHGRWAGA